MCHFCPFQPQDCSVDRRTHGQVQEAIGGEADIGNFDLASLDSLFEASLDQGMKP